MGLTKNNSKKALEVAVERLESYLDLANAIIEINYFPNPKEIEKIENANFLKKFEESFKKRTWRLVMGNWWGSWDELIPTKDIYELFYLVHETFKWITDGPKRSRESPIFPSKSGIYFYFDHENTLQRSDTNILRPNFDTFYDVAQKFHEKIRRCVCKKFFFAARKDKVNCSEECANRRRFKDWYKKNAEQKMESVKERDLNKKHLMNKANEMRGEPYKKIVEELLRVNKKKKFGFTESTINKIAGEV